MKRKLRWSMFLVAALLLNGCYYYPQPMAVAVPGPSLGERFDRSWNAAIDAMADQRVTVISQDRGAGVIRGTQGEITVTVTLQTLADGSIQVAFNTSGATASSPNLVNRLSESYDRRMGR